jgi:hypothetical protein
MISNKNSVIEKAIIRGVVEVHSKNIGNARHSKKNG